MSDDLWGDLPEPQQIETPAGILREQGSLLSQKTNRKLIGRVRANPTSLYEDGTPRSIKVDFVLATRSRVYSNLVLSAIYDPVYVYPCEIKVSATGETINAHDAADFKAKLKTVLQSAKIRDVIAAIQRLPT